MTSESLSRSTISEHLFAAMKSVAPYPDGMAEVPQMLPDTAFFPGGSGLWLDEPGSDLPDVLVLANDFGMWTDHAGYLAGVGRDLDTPTWRELISLAGDANLDLGRCFFSNATMGLRTVGNSTNDNSAHKDSAFRLRNSEFLRYQIELLSPRLVIALGKSSVRHIASLAPSQFRVKANFSYSYLDKNGLSWRRGVKIGRVHTDIVSMLHPCLRIANQRFRTYKDLAGDAAEKRLLRDALEAVGRTG